MKINNIQFPDFSGIRCLMMPYIQGDIESIPIEYRGRYDKILSNIYFKKGDIGYLTIDESVVEKNNPHRGARSKWDRALHTEAGIHPDKVYAWGGGNTGWGSSHRVTLDRDTKVLLSNSIDNSCAIWDEEVENTSIDGDIGDLSYKFPYSSATFMKAGEVHEIGILTPHESVPVKERANRQFLRIVSSGVHGREDYFTINTILNS